MVRKIVYWGSTGLVSLALLGSLSYLAGSEQVVSGFTKAGYPQHLRIVLGIAKPAAAIVLLLPGFALLKESIRESLPVCIAPIWIRSARSSPMRRGIWRQSYRTVFGCPSVALARRS